MHFVKPQSQLLYPVWSDIYVSSSYVNMSAATLYISILRGAGVVKRPTTTIIAIIQVF
jgi:hypothetical protein